MVQKKSTRRFNFILFTAPAFILYALFSFCPSARSLHFILPTGMGLPQTRKHGQGRF